MQEPTAPGWYPDPQDPRRERWWSGRAWTERWKDRQPSGGATAEPPGRVPPPRQSVTPGADEPIPLDLGGGGTGRRPAPRSGPTTGPYGAPLSPLDAIREGFTRILDWRGRSSRSAFWWLWLLGVVVNIGSSIWDAFVLTRYPEWISLPYFDPSIPSYVDVIALLMIPVSLVGAAAVVGAGIRRMHDVGRTGWFVLVPFYNLYLLAQPSEPTANRWG